MVESTLQTIRESSSEFKNFAEFNGFAKINDAMGKDVHKRSLTFVYTRDKVHL